MAVLRLPPPRRPPRADGASLVLLAILVTVVVAAMLTALAGARRTETAFDRYLDEVRPFDAGDQRPDGAARPAGHRGRRRGRRRRSGSTGTPPSRGTSNTQFFPMIVPDDARVPETYPAHARGRGPSARPDGAARGRARRAVRSAPRRDRRRSAPGGDLHERPDGRSGSSPSDGVASWSLDVVGILRAPATWSAGRTTSTSTSSPRRSRRPTATRSGCSRSAR